ncbi:MAG: XdhC/CoxI family protein [Nannocystaceae bacterium]
MSLGVFDADLFRAVADLLSDGRGRTGALATVIGRTGSAPQIVGAKLVLFSDGRQLGTVGGGTIEALVLKACGTALRSGASSRVSADLVRDLAMCCGGSMEVFVEYLQGKTRIVIIGAGHIARALAPLACMVGFMPLVVDDREELLADPSFEHIARLPYDTDELDVAVPDLSEHDYVVIVSRDHQRDERALAHLLERPHRYLGMIGSRRKVIRVMDRILRRYDDRGRDRPDLARVHAPVGLALGGRTPQEIAISIVAELIADVHGGCGRAMSIACAQPHGTPTGNASTAQRTTDGSADPNC